MTDNDTIWLKLDETNRLLQGLHDSLPGFLEVLMRIADSAERVEHAAAIERENAR